MTSFEAYVCQLLHHCPVIRLRKTPGRNGTAEQLDGYVAAFDLKAGKGETGVEFRYHSKAEYARLPTDQKEELKKFRLARTQAGLSPKLSENGKRKPGKAFGNGKLSNKKMKAEVKSAVTEAMTALLSSANTTPTLLNNVSATVAATAAKPETDMSGVIGRLRNNLALKGKTNK